MTNQYPWKEKEEITLQKEKTYKRFSIKSIFSELLNIILVNKGLFYTIKQLTIAPGVTLHGYLGTDRDKITGAAKYFILLVGLFYFAYFQFTHVKYVEDYLKELEIDSIDFAQYFQVYFLDQLSIWSALAIFLFAWMSRLFYKSHTLNYAEHLIIHTYINAQIAIYKLILLPSVYFISHEQYHIIESIVFYFYYVFVFHHFFQEKILNTFWKTLLVVVFGYALFFLAVLFFWFGFGLYLGMTGALK